MFQASSTGFLALIAVAMCWGLAVVLYRVGTPGSVARKLALLLVIEGVTLISTGYIDLFLGPAARAHVLYPSWLRAEEIAHTFGDCAMLALAPDPLRSPSVCVISAGVSSTGRLSGGYA